MANIKTKEDNTKGNSQRRDRQGLQWKHSPSGNGVNDLITSLFLWFFMIYLIQCYSLISYVRLFPPNVSLLIIYLYVFICYVLLRNIYL